MGRNRYFTSRVLENRALCDAVCHVTLERDDGQPVTYKPGQFVMIHFPNPDGVEVNRSYSLSSLPDEPFALCVKRVEGGLGSTLVHGLKPGDTLKTSGPYGRFTLGAKPPRDIVLVATGTGVAPYRAMIPQLEALLADSHRVWLLFGARYVRELLYDDTWRALAERHAEFTYLPIVSRPEPDEGWTGPVGYVSAFMDEVNAAINPEDAIAYLCGVPAMIDDMRERFMERGLSRRAVKTEKYVSPPPPSA